MNRERLEKQFTELVQIDSPSFGERQMADYLKKKLETLGFFVEEDDAGEKIGGNCGNLLARKKVGLTGEPLLFSMHMDTVDPSIGKKPVRHEDGTITSGGDTVLGADDMSGMAAFLEAITWLEERSLACRDIELLITVAEERHLLGSRAFDYSRLTAKESYVLDLSGEIGLCAGKAPSLATFEAVFHGKSAHAGFEPEKGVHAVAAAAAAVARMPLGRPEPGTTLNVGSISGGGATNVVPDSCTVKGEIRCGDHGRMLEELISLRSLCEEEAKKRGAEVSFQQEVYFKAYETPREHRVVRRFEKACEKVGVPFTYSETFGGSDQHHLCEHGIAGIVLASAMHECHSCREYTNIEEMNQVSELVKELLTMDF